MFMQQDFSPTTRKTLFCSYFHLDLQRPWHEYEHNFQIMYKVGMGHKPPIPEKLSTEGKDFLGHCLESEPKRRWTANMLLDHPFVKVRQMTRVITKHE